MIKNRSLDRSSPVNSFIPSALHQNMNVSSRQFNASTAGSTNQNMRPSLNLFNGSLQKTFATGYVVCPINFRLNEFIVRSALLFAEIFLECVNCQL